MGVVEIEDDAVVRSHEKRSAAPAGFLLCWRGPVVGGWSCCRTLHLLTA
jgi:hypothetical protein